MEHTRPPAEMLSRLLKFHGDNSKAIIWEHNTHVGDARYTDMSRDGMVNVGQLVREKYGEENVYVVGFGSYEGTVVAAEAWGAPIKQMQLPKAQKGSWEEIMHTKFGNNQLVF